MPDEIPVPGPVFQGGTGSIFRALSRGRAAVQEGRSLQAMGEQAASVFATIRNSPEAAEIAEMARTDPAAFNAMAQQFGGAEKLYNLIQARQANLDVASTMADPGPGSTAVERMAAQLMAASNGTMPFETAVKQAQEMLGAEFGAINLDDHTMESVERFKRSGDHNDLELKPEHHPRGTRIRLADGTIIEYGGNDLGTTANNQLESRLLASRNALDRTDRMIENFRPRFQKYIPRAKLWFKRQFQKFTDMDPVDQMEMAEFKRHHRTATEHMNRTIVEMTGKQMSRAEAERIKAMIPNPGPLNFKTLIDIGDNDVEYWEALMDYRESVRMAVARDHWVRRNGLSGWVVENDGDAENMLYRDPNGAVVDIFSMRGIMESRERQIEADLRSLGQLSEEEIDRAVINQLRVEFGI